MSEDERKEWRRMHPDGVDWSVCHTGLEPRTSRLRAPPQGTHMPQRSSQCIQTGMLLTRLSLALAWTGLQRLAEPEGRRGRAA